MTVRTAEAEWRGGLKDGGGTVTLGSGAFSGPYSFPSRFESGPGTNPEELIGAAHAGCFSMALSLFLGQQNHVPERIHTKASVHLEPKGGGFSITRIDLDTEAVVPGLDPATFQTLAEQAKTLCPVSQALAGTEITLSARLA